MLWLHSALCLLIHLQSLPTQLHLPVAAVLMHGPHLFASAWFARRLHLFHSAKPILRRVPLESHVPSLSLTLASRHEPLQVLQLMPLRLLGLQVQGPHLPRWQLSHPSLAKLSASQQVVVVVVLE